MATLLRGLLRAGVTPELSSVDAKHVQITNLLALLAAAAIGMWVPVAVVQGQPAVALQNAVAAGAYAGAYALNRRGHHTPAAVVLSVLFHLQLAFALMLFGHASGTTVWYGAAVVAPYLVFQRRRRGLAHLFAGLGLALWVAAAALQAQLPGTMRMVAPEVSEAINTVLAAVTLAAAAAGFLWMVDQTEDALDHARARADSLLLNVLPPSIAARLKADPHEPIADRHDQVTVLFADLVGFTALSGRESAARTVELLNEVFSAFDRFCEEEGIEKIKTMGDGYLAISGAPEPREDRALAVARVAIRMRDHMASDPTGMGLAVRIGLNTGAVVGGIVGSSRFQYDVWSDAVNVAARMESHGEPGRIQLTRQTWAHIHEQIPCASRGVIEVKGKGPMETYFVR